METSNSYPIFLAPFPPLLKDYRRFEFSLCHSWAIDMFLAVASPNNRTLVGLKVIAFSVKGDRKTISFVSSFARICRSALLIRSGLQFIIILMTLRIWTEHLRCPLILKLFFHPKHLYFATITGVLAPGMALVHTSLLASDIYRYMPGKTQEYGN